MAAALDVKVPPVGAAAVAAPAVRPIVDEAGEFAPEYINGLPDGWVDRYGFSYHDVPNFAFPAEIDDKTDASIPLGQAEQSIDATPETIKAGASWDKFQLDHNVRPTMGTKLWMARHATFPEECYPEIREHDTQVKRGDIALGLPVGPKWRDAVALRENWIAEHSAYDTDLMVVRGNCNGATMAECQFWRVVGVFMEDYDRIKPALESNGAASKINRKVIAVQTWGDVQIHNNGPDKLIKGDLIAARLPSKYWFGGKPCAPMFIQKGRGLNGSMNPEIIKVQPGLLNDLIMDLYANHFLSVLGWDKAIARPMKLAQVAAVLRRPSKETYDAKDAKANSIYTKYTPISTRILLGLKSHSQRANERLYTGEEKAQVHLHNFTRRTRQPLQPLVNRNHGARSWMALQQAINCFSRDLANGVDIETMLHAFLNVMMSTGQEVADLPDRFTAVMNSQYAAERRAEVKAAADDEPDTIEKRCKVGRLFGVLVSSLLPAMVQIRKLMDHEEGLGNILGKVVHGGDQGGTITVALKQF